VPSAGEVVIRIRSIGLNFRDVLNVMGMYPGDPGYPGGDSSGTVVAVSEGTKFKVGDDVFGIAWGCVRTYCATNALLLDRKPAEWSYEQAAAWPVTYTTTDEAFTDMAKLTKGDRVLIHAATGGVGIIAVQYAQRVGAVVYATAGKDEKQQFLRDMGVKYITSTRDAAQFEADMAKFCKEDGVTGVDVVLNSLSHDDYIPKTLKYLKKKGRFMEIGKRNVYTKEQMTAERPDVYYELLALDYYMEHDPPKFNSLLTRLAPEVAKGWWKPVPVTPFVGLEEGPNAFRYLQRAQQIGKVVISIPSRMDLKPDATYVLSGGMGAIGLLTARTLIEEGAKNVVLLSRSGKPASDAAEQWEWLQTTSAKVVSKRCDVANAQAAKDTMKEIGKSGMPPVKGAMHLAAVLDDALLPKLTQAHFEKSFGAKVEGARNLHDALDMSIVDFLVLFSSTSALMGSPGQGNYSAANSALDALAYFYKQQGEKVVSIQWGPWSEAGMAAQKGTVERLRSQGIGGVDNALGMSMLSAALATSSSMVVAQPFHWSTYLKQYPRLPAFLMKFGKEAKSTKPKAAGARAQVSENVWTPDRVLALVREVAMDVVGSADLADASPLMEAGMDSLSAVEFRNRIQTHLPDVKMPNTLIFDYPTIAAIKGYIVEQVGPVTVGAQAPLASGWTQARIVALVRETAMDVVGSGDLSDNAPLMEAGMDSLSAVEFRNRIVAELPDVKMPNTLIFDYPSIAAIGNYVMEQLGPAVMPVASAGLLAPTAADEPVAVCGLACRFPAGCDTPEVYWDKLLARVDGMIEIPYSRWDINEYYDENPGQIGKMYTRKGAFIEGGDLFDAAFFGIGGAEVKSMDPQQRLLLEVSYDALHRSGGSKDSLMGSDCGVFIGQTTNDWVQLSGKSFDHATPYSGTGMSASVSAGRISYILGLKGPSYSVDTACSSSLVALDNAVSNLRRGRCSTAVCSGVNMMLSPGTYISFSQARMLSPDGRCATFDESANGYARGEGCGAAVLKLLSAATSEFREVLALVRGTAVNQDGRSSSLTAPNGPSQQDVIRAALKDAQSEPLDVNYVECHGTGTALGDPIEVGALKGVLAPGRAADSPVVLGCAKSNIGHLEGAAGVAGLVKAVLAIQKKTVPPNIHFKKLNPHIDIDGFPVVMPTSQVALPANKPIVAGLSSFGFGGTNSHVVLGEAPAQDNPRPLRGPMEYNRQPYPWRETGPRMLRRKIEVDGKPGFEVTIQDDLYKVVSEHVVFGSIVVPGVVYVEMALESVRMLFGPDTYLRDMEMMFPLVVPWQKEGRDPGTLVKLRFVMIGADRFALQSMPGGDAAPPITHAEGDIGRGLPEVPTVDSEDLKFTCSEKVQSAAVYKKIHDLGLYLGPQFQVAKDATISPDREDILCRLQLTEDVPNNGYVMHPAVLDGTIHSVGTHAATCNTTSLRVFGGVKSVSIFSTRDFSKDTQFWVHINVSETTEQEQTFTCTIFTDEGDVLFVLGDVAFRKVLPEQIQAAIKAQKPADAQRIYEVEWIPGTGDADFVAEDDKMLVVRPALAGDLAGLPVTQSVMSVEDAVSAMQSGSFTKVVSFAPLEEDSSPADVLDGAMRLIQAVGAQPVAERPALFFCTRATQMRDQVNIPIHAGVWASRAQRAWSTKVRRLAALTWPRLAMRRPRS
jgi:acyl transferase domain-containing protein/NADPH:quinone reductase-like Zn-dependent oxidoreductase/NAD(P)-dependent dehydrogenase (short-subunit alcohol dehydrogenase family)/acyl carrier protein